MPDRLVNLPARLLADIPGLTDEAVTVDVRDGADVHVSAGDAINLFTGRYQFDLDADMVVRQGQWVATWTCEAPATTYTQAFTVGPRPSAPISRFELRLLVGEAVGTAYDSTITDSDGEEIADDTIIGGPDNYRGWWVALDSPSIDAGRFRRVTDYNGSSMTLSSPLGGVPVSQTRYALFDMDPRRIDKAIDVAISDLSAIGRVGVRYSDIAVADNVLNVPVGITWVTGLWGEDVEGEEAEIPIANWEMLPGRRLRLATPAFDDTEAVTLTGIRPLSALVWDDSYLDIEPGPIVARARQHLHSTKAAGQGVDIDEHMRRQLAAENEYKDARRWVGGRARSGAMQVID